MVYAIAVANEQKNNSPSNIHTQLCIKARVTIIWLSTEVCHSGEMPDLLQLPPPLRVSTKLPLKIKPNLLQTKRGLCNRVLVNYSST